MYRPGLDTRPAIAQLIFLAAKVANSLKTGLESSSFISSPEFRAGIVCTYEERVPSLGSLSFVAPSQRTTFQGTCLGEVPITLNPPLNPVTQRASKYLPGIALSGLMPTLPGGCITLGSVVR
jgi:hypothetical protein